MISRPYLLVNLSLGAMIQNSMLKYFLVDIDEYKIAEDTEGK